MNAGWAIDMPGDAYTNLSLAMSIGGGTIRVHDGFAFAGDGRAVVLGSGALARPRTKNQFQKMRRDYYEDVPARKHTTYSTSSF